MNRIVLATWSMLHNQLNKERTLYALLVLLVVALWVPRIHGPIDLRWDGAVYYVLGTSLAEGKGYRLLNEPGEIQANQYPPLFPLIIAAHQVVLGSNDPVLVGHWLRLSSFAIFLGYIVTIFMVLRNDLPLENAFFGTLICLFQMSTYFMSDLLFPEILYGLVTTCFVLCCRQTHKRGYAVAAALLAVAAFGLRTIGIALLVAWIAESLFKRDIRRTVGRFVIALVPVLCWQAYVGVVVSGSEYNRPAYEYQRAAYMFYNVSYATNIFTLKESFSPELGAASFLDLVRRFLDNAIRIPSALGEAVSVKRDISVLPWKWFDIPPPFSTPWSIDLMLLLLGSLILTGIVLELIGRRLLLPSYVLLALAAACLTPWAGQFNRYLMPLSPFLVLFLFKSIMWVGDQSGAWKRVGSVCSGLLVLVVVIEELFVLGATFARKHQDVVYNDQRGEKVRYRLLFYHDAYRALDAGLDWLQERAEPPAVLAGSMPHWMYLRTKLKAVMPPFEADPVKAQALLDSVPVTYLFLDEGLAVDTKKYMMPVIRKYPERWERIYVDTIIPEHPQDPGGEFAIYQRVERSDTSPAIPAGDRDSP